MLIISTLHKVGATLKKIDMLCFRFYNKGLELKAARSSPKIKNPSQRKLTLDRASFNFIWC